MRRIADDGDESERMSVISKRSHVINDEEESMIDES